MVRRYFPSVAYGRDGEYAFMEPDSFGDYVRHDDYAALESRVAELEKDAARYRWLLNCGTPNLWRKCGDMDSYDDVEKEIDEAMSREA